MAEADGRAGGGPVVRIAELEVDPARAGAYAALLREEVEASVAREPGVIALQAVTLRGRPDLVRILEVYADRTAYDAHLRSPHFLRYKAATEGMVLSLRLLEADPLAMRAKAGGPFEG